MPDGSEDPLEYTDLIKLPFMTKCIMETLRRWPAVANGTFRELQFDDFVEVRHPWPWRLGALLLVGWWGLSIVALSAPFLRVWLVLVCPGRGR